MGLKRAAQILETTAPGFKKLELRGFFLQLGRLEGEGAGFEVSDFAAAPAGAAAKSEASNPEPSPSNLPTAEKPRATMSNIPRPEKH